MFPQLLAIGAQLYPHIMTLRAQVLEAMADGGLSATEARDLGIALSKELGDLRIAVKGRDVLRGPTNGAQAELFGALGRIARQVCIALGEDT